MASLLGKITADFSTSLSTEIAIGGTTATLASATDDDGVALPAGRYFFALEGTNSNKEHISCDLVGTALTNIKSLSRQGVETTGCVRKHRIGSSVTLTDFAHIKFINDLVSGATNLNASTPLGYDGAPASLTGNQLATVTYVLGVVNGGAVTFDQQTISNQTSGEALAINDVVYFKESDARWYKVDADLTATFDGLQMGINKTTAAGAAVTIQVSISGPVSAFSGLSAGSKYYASNTAGAITTTPGTYSVFVGWALTTTILLFTPFVKTLPTQKEKDALAGSQGIPSSTNKYGTQDNQSVGLEDQSQTTQNGTVEVGEADATTKKNKLAQSFIPTKTKIRGVELYKSADTGTFTGTVTVSLQADTTGSPSGTPLATVTFTNQQWVGKTVGSFEAIFTSEYASIVAGSLYWIVIETSTSDNSNHPNVGTNTAGGYSSGSAKYKNTTDSWVAIATIDLYFKTLEGTVSQVVKTNTSGKIESTFYSVSEMPISAFQQSIPLDSTASDPTRAEGGTSNSDGSVIFLSTDAGSTDIIRFQRDSKTGAYFRTHTVDGAVGGFSASVGMIVLGDYLYVFYDAGANVGSYRYLAADLTGEQAMTLPAIAAASTGSVAAWTDNKYAYIISDDASTVVNVLSVSGTVFSAVTTATFANSTLPANTTSFFDGNNVYLSRNASAGDLSIYKLTVPDGSTLSTTNLKLYNWSDIDLLSPNVQLIVNIDSERMYIGRVVPVYDEAAIVAATLNLIPVTKP